MRLLRLLTAGRSLVGLKEAARFREADPKSMPKFGGKKPAISGSAEWGKPETKPATKRHGPVNPKSEIRNPKQIRMDGNAENEETRAGRFAPAAQTLMDSSAKRPEETEKGDEAGGWISRWWSWGRRKPAAIPRFNKLLVQAELSLDRVKVLRNDLSDCDLEVRTAEKTENAGQTDRGRERGRGRSAEGSLNTLDGLNGAGQQAAVAGNQ